MGSLKTWIAAKFFSEYFGTTNDATSAKSRDIEKGIIKRLGLRFGDIASKDFEPPEFDLIQIYNGYNTDSYIRQGIDKYIDQMFKEGYTISGKDETVTDYIKMRLAFIAEATGTPTGQLLIDIAEDVVKYSNCIIAKARATDQAQLPPTVKVQGLMGFDPVGGYFCLNATTMKVKRDKFGAIQGWQQEVEGADKPVNFKAGDIIHIYYKREKGNAFGTSFLVPVLDDVRALRQAEENVLRMLYRNIYPFYHVKVGDKDTPGTPQEIQDVQDAIDNMNVEGGIATTNRVEIKPIASDQVINAEPYLRYLEDRVFSGMGVPAIMFGRGNTANRSTGDNMTSEMADRIKAIQRTIEMFINQFMIKELLMEGGYDPVLNPDHIVEFWFNENDLDSKIKAETHAIYQYEHNSITEDEMRAELGRDPITDRGLMFQTLVSQANAEHSAKVGAQYAPKTEGGNSAGTKETNNKQKPTNQNGTKTSPKKTTNSAYEELISDRYSSYRDSLDTFITQYYDNQTDEGKDFSRSMIYRTITNACTDVFHITDEIYKDNDNNMSRVYYTHCFKLLKDDITEYITSIKDMETAKGLISSLLDIYEDKLLCIASTASLFEGKEVN